MLRGRLNVNRRPPAFARQSSHLPPPLYAPGRSALRTGKFGVGMRPAASQERGPRMKNYLDGGEAILEAFRKLRIDYIMSSPGSEWSPVWEALARQKLDNTPGPTFIESWHETLAVNMATGYTLITGRPQAVLLHAGVGMLQGSMGVHGALQNEVPMVVMSGESQTLGEDPDLDIEQQWYGGAHRRRHRALRRAGRQMGARGDQPLYALRERDPRRRDGAAHAEGADLSQRPARAHAARLDAAGDGPRRAAARRRCSRSRRTSRRSPTLLLQGEEPGHRGGDLGPRPEGVLPRWSSCAELLADPGDRRPRQRLRQFPERSSALSRRRHLQRAERRRSRPAGGRARALVSAAHSGRPAARSSPISENPLKGSHGLPEPARRLLSRRRRRGRRCGCSPRRREAAKLDDAAIARAPRQRWTREHESYVAGLRSRARRRRRTASGIDPLSLLGALGEVMPADTIYRRRDHHPLACCCASICRWTKPQSFFRGRRRARPGHRHRARHQARGAQAAGRAAHRRRRVPLQPDHPGARRLQAARPADHHRRPQQQEVRGDAQGPRASLSRRRVGPAKSCTTASTIDGPDYDQLGSHFGFHGQRVEKPGRAQGRARKPRSPPPRAARPRSSTSHQPLRRRPPAVT